MKTILDKIIENKISEVEQLRKKYRYSDFEQMPFFNKPCISLEDTIRSKDFGIIAEIKRKSPAAGEIRSEIDAVRQAKLYERSGCAGISYLTDYKYFGGHISYLNEVKSNVSIPVLRKEFIIDELQLFEAKANGADAVLLIAGVLDKHQLLQFTIIAQSLGMEIILEFHNKSELDKLNDLVNIIGINNRDLRSQRTDVHKSFELIDLLPKDKVLISESGIQSSQQINALYKIGYQGALIGESILKSENPEDFIFNLHSKNLLT